MAKELCLVNMQEFSDLGDYLREVRDEETLYKVSDLYAVVKDTVENYGEGSSGTTINNQNKTVTPTENSQSITADSGYTGLGTVTVSAVSSSYIGSGITQKSAASYTPGTSDQTIAAGQYLAGAQTIEGDSNLIASNIKSGTSIFGITGSYTGSGSGGSSTVGTATTTGSASTTLTFSGLVGEPIAFALVNTGNQSLTSGYYYISSVIYDGSSCIGSYVYYKSGGGGSRYLYADSTHYSCSYSNGTLTITSSASSTTAGGYFPSIAYKLIYVY